MLVRVHVFAAYREAIGARQVDVEVPTGSTVGDVWQTLRNKYPGLRTPRPAAAVNEEYAPLDTPIQSGDEIAFLPPVSGGW